eukprot:RCo045892
MNTEFPAKVPKVTVSFGSEVVPLLLHFPRPEGFVEIDEDIPSQVTAYNLRTLFKLAGPVSLCAEGGADAEVLPDPEGNFPLTWQTHQGVSFKVYGEPLVASQDDPKKAREKTEQANIRSKALARTLEHAGRKAETTFEDWKKKVQQRARSQKASGAATSPPSELPATVTPPVALCKASVNPVLSKSLLQAAAAITPSGLTLSPAVPLGPSPGTAGSSSGDLPRISAKPHSLPLNAAPSDAIATKPIPEKDPPKPKSDDFPEIVVCERCSEKIPGRNMELHLLNCVKRKTSCSTCGVVIDSEMMTEHIKEEHTLIACECAQRMLARDLPQHKATNCPLRQMQCNYCELIMPLKELHAHEAQCGSRTEPCEHCGQRFELRTLPGHSRRCKSRGTSDALMDHFAEKVTTSSADSGKSTAYRSSDLPNSTSSSSSTQPPQASRPSMHGSSARSEVLPSHLKPVTGPSAAVSRKTSVDHPSSKPAKAIGRTQGMASTTARVLESKPLIPLARFQHPSHSTSETTSRSAPIEPSLPESKRRAVSTKTKPGAVYGASSSKPPSGGRHHVPVSSDSENCDSDEALARALQEEELAARNAGRSGETRPVVSNRRAEPDILIPPDPMQEASDAAIAASLQEEEMARASQTPLSPASGIGPLFPPRMPPSELRTSPAPPRSRIPAHSGLRPPHPVDPQQGPFHRMHFGSPLEPVAEADVGVDEALARAIYESQLTVTTQPSSLPMHAPQRQRQADLDAQLAAQLALEDEYDVV